MVEIISDVASVEFDRRRWYVRLTLRMADGTTREMVVDAALQSGDAIWFGSAEEWAQAVEDA